MAGVCYYLGLAAAVGWLLLCACVQVEAGGSRLSSYRAPYKSATSGEGCEYTGYEGAGQGDVIDVSAAPTYGAAVPVSIMGNMLGVGGTTLEKASKHGANTFNTLMHGTNAIKSFGLAGKKFAEIAPKLAPCLGLLGVGFGAVFGELTKITPKQIIDEVNKAIEKVVDGLNRRMDMMQELFEKDLKDMKVELVDKLYKGILDRLMVCLDKTTLQSVNDELEDIASDMIMFKRMFMHDDQWKDDLKAGSSIEVRPMVIKTMEAQLPITQRFAVLHLLVYANLIETFKETDPDKYLEYKRGFVREAEYYVAYMEWAYAKIYEARIENMEKSALKVRSDFIDFEDYQDSTAVTPGTDFMRSMWVSYLYRTSRKAKFQCSKLNHRKCSLTANLRCIWGPGSSRRNAMKCQTFVYTPTTIFDPYHQRVSEAGLEFALGICNSKRAKMKKDLEKYFDNEVLTAIPIIKAAIQNLQETGLAGDLERRGLNTTAVVPEDADEEVAKEEEEEGEDEASGDARQVASPPATAAAEEKKRPPMKKDPQDEIEEAIAKGTSSKNTFSKNLKIMQRNMKLWKLRLTKKKKAAAAAKQTAATQINVQKQQ